MFNYCRAPQASSRKDLHGVERFKQYYTNNPKTFWAAPGKTTANANIKSCSGHTQAQYEAAMNRFKDCYNQKSSKCIGELVVSAFASHWTNAGIEDLIKDYGTMKSVKYMGMEIDNKWEDVALFKIECEKSVHCMALSLDEANKIGTLRFQTYSNYIDWLLAKELDKSPKAGK